MTGGELSRLALVVVRDRFRFAGVEAAECCFSGEIDLARSVPDRTQWSAWATNSAPLRVVVEMCVCCCVAEERSRRKHSNQILNSPHRPDNYKTHQVSLLPFPPVLSALRPPASYTAPRLPYRASPTARGRISRTRRGRDRYRRSMLTSGAEHCRCSETKATDSRLPWPGRSIDRGTRWWEKRRAGMCDKQQARQSASQSGNRNRPGRRLVGQGPNGCGKLKDERE